MPGQQSFMAQSRDGFCMAAIVNMRSKGDMSGDLNNLIWNMRLVIKHWPGRDLK